VHISVIGTGYLGATHAACLASTGHRVVGIDRNASQISRLSDGVAPFHEPGLDRLLRVGRDDGGLHFSTDIRDARGARVHFLCVGTPQQPGSDAADLTALEAAVDDLAPLLDGPCLVVGKSTVPVGTARRLADRLRAAAPAGDAVTLAWNPEFLREGQAVQDSLRPDRLVFGVADEESDRLLRQVYADAVRAGVPVVRTDLETAELAKVSANAMLATRVSLVNLLAEVCEAAQADVADLTAILGLDARIGHQFLNPGLGYGGGCLPKDTRAFVARAEELGVTDSARLLREVDAVNLRQRARVVESAVAMLGGDASAARVAVLGAAFKAGSDDVRDSPSLHVAAELQSRGAEVWVYDPRAGARVASSHPRLRVAASVEGAASDADLVLVLTEWDEFRGIDPVALADVVAARRIIDGRLMLDPEKWRAAGWDLYALGRGSA
jgi:UDPglucose 6-dehydrogenase